MSLKSAVLSAVQSRTRSVMQPLYTEQSALREETTRRLDEASKRVSLLEERLKDLTSSVLYSRWMQSPNAVYSRNELGCWLNWLGLLGNGVEVGVFTGEFSSRILETWNGAKLVSVDPWREFPTNEYVDISNVPQDQQEAHFRETTARLSRFGERSRILRKTSAEAASEFSEATLEFVYLDAQHHYEAVRDDIRLWYSKVKKGGVLGGHDYLDGVIPSGLYGVKTAVDEFAAEKGLELVITRDPGWPSWFVRID